MQIRKNGYKDECHAESVAPQRHIISISNPTAFQHHQTIQQKTKHSIATTQPNLVHPTCCLLPIDCLYLKANPEHHKRHSNTIADPSMSTRLYTEESSPLSRGMDTFNCSKGVTMDKDVFIRDNYSAIARKRIAVLKKSQSDCIYKFVTPFSSNQYKVSAPNIPLEIMREKYLAFIGHLKSREKGMIDTIIKLQNRLRGVQKCLAKYESIK